MICGLNMVFKRLLITTLFKTQMLFQQVYNIKEKPISKTKKAFGHILFLIAFTVFKISSQMRVQE